MIRVLVVDDHELVRIGLRQILADYPAIRIVAEAADGETALRLNRRLKPDIVLLDIRMPGLTGMEILEGIQNINNFPPMILITSFGDHETDSLAERFGAAAIINKPFDIDDLLNKIMETFSQTQ